MNPIRKTRLMRLGRWIASNASGIAEFFKWVFTGRTRE